jgi:hypothetical protein
MKLFAFGLRVDGTRAPPLLVMCVGDPWHQRGTSPYRTDEVHATLRAFDLCLCRHRTNLLADAPP